jgi:two-component system chemotaxis response regulator CheB
MGIDPLRRVLLDNGPPENGTRPSISYLFRSVEKIYGRISIAVLLTGMGKDGAFELGRIRHAGGITIVQDRHSSAVYGMPSAALELNAATFIMDPVRIAQSLQDFIKQVKQGAGTGNESQ